MSTEPQPACLRPRRYSVQYVIRPHLLRRYDASGKIDKVVVLKYFCIERVGYGTQRTSNMEHMEHMEHGRNN